MLCVFQNRVNVKAPGKKASVIITEYLNLSKHNMIYFITFAAISRTRKVSDVNNGKLYRVFKGNNKAYCPVLNLHCFLELATIFNGTGFWSQAKCLKIFASHRSEALVIN